MEVNTKVIAFMKYFESTKLTQPVKNKMILLFNKECLLVNPETSLCTQ